MSHTSCSGCNKLTRAEAAFSGGVKACCPLGQERLDKYRKGGLDALTDQEIQELFSSGTSLQYVREHAGRHPHVLSFGW